MYNKIFRSTRQKPLLNLYRIINLGKIFTVLRAVFCPPYFIYFITRFPIIITYLRLPMYACLFLFRSKILRCNRSAEPVGLSRVPSLNLRDAIADSSRILVDRRIISVIVTPSFFFHILRARTRVILYSLGIPGTAASSALTLNHDTIYNSLPLSISVSPGSRQNNYYAKHRRPIISNTIPKIRRQENAGNFSKEMHRNFVYRHG